MLGEIEIEGYQLFRVVAVKRVKGHDLFLKGSFGLHIFRIVNQDSAQVSVQGFSPLGQGGAAQEIQQVRVKPDSSFSLFLPHES